MGEEEEMVECVLDTISINDAFEVVSGAFSSISDLSEESKGFDDDCTSLPKRKFFAKLKFQLCYKFLGFSNMAHNHVKKISQLYLFPFLLIHLQFLDIHCMDHHFCVDETKQLHSPNLIFYREFPLLVLGVLLLLF